MKEFLTVSKEWGERPACLQKYNLDFLPTKNVLFIGQFSENKMELNLLQFIRSKK